MHKDITPPPAASGSLLFDWQLDIERLEQQADEAAATGVPDPWVLVEAECSLDLIEAELSALSKIDARKSDPSATYLKRWRDRAEALLMRLRKLEGSAYA